MELIENNTTGNQNKSSRDYSDSYLRAKRKVDNIKGFYTHFIVYIVVNTFITWQQVSEHMENGKSLVQAFQDNGTYMVWMLWGFGLVFHGLNVFITNGVFGQKWEDRKIKQYMDGQKNRSWDKHRKS